MLASRDLRLWFGVGGVPPHDNAKAYRWEERLTWLMAVVALLAVPGLLIENTDFMAEYAAASSYLDILVFLFFAAEFLLMMGLVKQRLRYLRHNWLNLVILAVCAANLFGLSWHWAPLVRLLRVAYVLMVFVRMLVSLRRVLSPKALPTLLVAGMVVLGIAGGLYTWLEPTIHSFGDGLWLAFTTGSTVGYGDVIPTVPITRVLSVFIVLMGLTILSLVTASLSAFFIGGDDSGLRQEIVHEIRGMRKELHDLHKAVEGLEARLQQAGEASVSAASADRPAAESAAYNAPSSSGEGHGLT